MVTPSAEVRLVWNPSAGGMGPPSAQAPRSVTPFIKGPLQLLWLHTAAALPGKALHVAMALLYVKGLCCSATFPFKRKFAKGFTVSPDATYDALTNLERAGLISISRHRGRSPVVTVLDPSAHDQPVNSIIH